MLLAFLFYGISYPVMALFISFPMYYGPEFISKDVDLWAYWNHVKLDFSRPGKPTDNAYIESFNARFRLDLFPFFSARLDSVHVQTYHPSRWGEAKRGMLDRQS
jgi:transposase InsO family protein